MTPRNETGNGPTEEPRAPEHRSTATLLTDVVDQVSELFRKELQLFRAEIGEKSNQAFAAMGMIVGGIVLSLVALNALMAALIALIDWLGLEEGWAALVAGLVVAIVGFALVSSGRNKLKASQLAPNRTADSLRRDADTARESVR